MTDTEQMQSDLADDLIGKNGDQKRGEALLDVFRLQLGTAFMPLMIKGGGDIGVKAIGNEIVITDAL